jgi:hypothetical protein
MRFASYPLALDHEESAALSFAQAIGEVQRWVERDDVCCRTPL